MICKRSNCSNDVMPNRMGPKRVYCCPECRKADVAMRERTRRGDEGRAMHAEANRRYRARLKAAQEAERIRLLAERIDRINAKARAAA